MKFLNIIKQYSFLAVIFLAFHLNAQNTTRSPYSSFGIGDVESSGYAFNSILGGAKYGFADPYQINISNPASYGAIKTPIFNVGLNYNRLTIYQGANNQKGNIGYLKNISLAFPVTKWWGVNFGVIPVSKMGYRFTNTETVTDFGTVDYSYEGKGGINRAFFGSGFNILKDTIHTLSFGFNASYYFGNIEKQKRVEPRGISNSFNALHSEQIKVSDVNFDLGLLYKRKFGKFTTTLGAAYIFGDSLKAYTTNYALTYKSTSLNDIVKDTIYNLVDTGKLYLPQTIGLGFTVQLNQKQDKYNKQYLLAIDYSTTDWSSLSLLEENLGLAKRNQLSIGFQYIPDSKSFKSIQKMINYRVGFRYTNTHLLVAGNNVSDYGISFGVGIPVINAGMGTMFNIGMEVGKRGDKSINPLYEQYTNIFIGFSLTPSKFDRWFYKSKID